MLIPRLLIVCGFPIPKIIDSVHEIVKTHRIKMNSSTGPGAAGEAPVGGVVVGRAFAVRVDLVREETRGFVVEPRGDVAGGEVLATVGLHGSIAQIMGKEMAKGGIGSNYSPFELSSGIAPFLDDD